MSFTRIPLAPTPAIVDTSRGSSFTLSQGQREALTRKYFTEETARQDEARRESDGYNPFAHLLAYPLATGINLVDDLAGNRLTGWLTGVEKGDVWNMVEDYGLGVGESLKNYYQANEGAVDLGSGLTGAIGVGYLTGAKLLPWVSSRLMASSALTGSKLWQSGAAFNAATRSRVLEQNLSAAYAQGIASSWSGAAVALRGIEIGKVAGLAALEEAAILTTMNANDLIWDPEDVANSVFWAAVGVGIGGGIGAIRARRTLRGFANAPEVILARAVAQDPLGVTRKAQARADSANIGIATPAPGASVTRNALQAYAAPRVNTGPLATRLNAEQSGSLSALSQDLTKLGMSDKQVRFFGTKVLAEDPLTFHGLDEIRPKNPTKWVNEQADIIKDPKSSLQAKIIARDTLDRMMVSIDGKWFPLKDSPEMYDFVVAGGIPPVPKILRTSPGVTEEVEVTLSKAGTRKISLAEAPKDFGTLPLRDRLHIADGFRLMLNTLKGQKLQYTLPDPTKAHWIQYDAALWHAQKNGGQVALPKGIASLDELETASLKMKADEILKNPDALSTPVDFIKYNLPVPTYMERIGTTTGERFKAVLTAAQRGASLQELRALRGTLQEIQGYARRGEGPAPVTGNLFDFNKDTEGTWTNPILATFSSRSVSLQDNILQMVEDDLVKDRFNTISILTGSLNDFVSDLGRSILTNPNFVKASNVHGLAQDQVTGIGSTLSQAAGETRSAEFRYRDSPTMLAVQQILELTQRNSDRYLRELVERSLGNTHEQLIGQAARPSRHLIHQFATYRRGWDLDDSMAQVEPGKYGFILAPTPKNEARLKRPVGDREFLVNPRTQVPVVVDDLGRNYLDGFQRLTDELLRNRNRTREALGLEPIRRIPWYQPPPPTKDKIVGFVLDANNKVVPGRTIIASSHEEYRQLADALERDTVNGLERGERLMTRDQIGAYKDIFDDAELNWVDPTALVAPGKSAKGGLGTEFVNTNSINDSMGWVKDQVESLGLATQRIMLDDQIRSARLRHDVEVAAGAVGKSGRTVYQEFEAHARGIPLSRLESSISGQAGKVLENLSRFALDVVWPQTLGLTTRRAGRWLDDIIQRHGVPASVAKRINTQTKTFKQLAESLGPYSPYRDFEDYLVQTHGHKAPPEIRSITASLNTLSSALILRYAEVAHASMNMLGLLTNMPSIVRSSRAPVTNFQVAGQTIPVVDTVRLLGAAVSDMVSKRSGPDWDFMVKNGDASQQVAELNKTFSLLTDRSSFGTYMLGTGSKQGKTGVKGLFKEKGVDGVLGVMTDTTENWSRQFSHFVGLRLADIHGIQGTEARHNFAREIANAGIANYSPATRPELYQSAFGSLLGLFTSWARAYNQRLFRWLEDSDYARFAEQYAIQSALFGVRSTPGFKAFEWALGGIDDEGNENPTLTDRIYARLGPQAGMAVANGGIAALTGLSLYTRGDVNLRAPSLNPIDHMPALSMLGKVGKAGLDIATHGVDPLLLGESFVRNMPNRMLRSVLTTVAMRGDEVDATGRIVTDTQTYTDAFARFVGVRSARQQNQADVYYANSAAMRDEAARIEPLRLHTRALIRRKGAGGVSSEEWAGLFDEYLHKGGNPRTFRTWIRSQIKETQSSRDLRQVEKQLKDPTNHLRILRHDMYMEGFR